MKYLSVCSGIEAATVAWHPLGWEPVAFSEIEPFPSALLAHHYPNTPNLGDMTKYLEWPEELLAEVDLIVGGIPCTAFSVAGARNSLSDPRGQLTLTYVKLINHIDSIRKKYDRQPTIIIYENVPGIYSTRDNAFGCLVGALCGQDEAIETETGKWPTTGIFWGAQRRVGYRTLDAQYFGVAQRRRRCFIVAVANETIEHFGNRYCPSEILTIAKSLRGDTAPSRKTWKEPTTHAANRTHRNSGGGSLLNAYQTTGAGYWREDQISGTLRAREQDSHEQLLAFNYNAQVDQMNFNPDTTATLSCSQGAAVAVFNKQSADAYDDDVSSTMMSRDCKSATDLVVFPIGTLNCTGQLGNRTMGIGKEEDPSYTLSVSHSHAVAYSMITANTNVNGLGVTEDLSPTLDQAQPAAIAFTQNTRDEVRYIGGDGQITGAIAASAGMKQTNYVCIGLDDEKNATEEVFGTLKSAMKSGNRTDCVLLPHMQIRSLTPMEGERLQGFPDLYTQIPYKSKPTADGPRYKAIGNSMATPVMRYLGMRIQQAVDYYEFSDIC